MKYTILKTLFILIIIFLMGAGFIFYGLYFAPLNLTIDFNTITSSKIPESLNDVKIGYFSDVYYLEYMDDDRVINMFQEMNDSDVDVLLFGGDLFSNPLDETITDEQIIFITEQLSSLKADLGKFYVLGDKDNTNIDLITSIMNEAGFELLSNSNVKIHNKQSTSITLIGLDNTINSTIDLESAFSNTSSKNFNLLFTHTPDSLLLLGDSSVDIAIAGHSLGGQISLPLIGTLNEIEGASQYIKGKYIVGNSTYYISNGLGTTDVDFRLFTAPQFQVFLLQSN